MKKVKISLVLLAGVFIAVSVINFKFDSVDYNKKSQKSQIFLLTLEALASDESGSGTTYTKYCKMYFDCYDKSGYPTGKQYL